MRSTDVIVESVDGELVRVQVKTTESPHYHDGSLKYALDVAAYNRLREGGSPGYLVVVVVHRQHPQWTEHFPTGAVVRASAYSLRLAGMAERAIPRR